MSAAFCDTHFRGMEQKAHSIVLPSVVLKGRYYMTQGQDLLTGSVPKKLIRFAFPLFLANLLQALYNVVDMLVVGKIVGKTGLAAISNASMLCFIINSLCIGLTMGGSVLVAQCKGANDQTGQRDTIGMLFFLSLVGSAVVTILGLAIYEALFQALNVPMNAYQDACSYMKIICCGTVFVFGYNAVCSILKGLGDSQTPLFFVGVATVLNVVLDVLLVGLLSMGTAGAAWATITAQGVSFMGSLVYLRRYQPGFSLRKIEFHREKLLAILKVGLPTAIQMVVVNTAYLLVTGMLNQFGTPVAAASGVGLKINTFAGMHCWAIGQAITAMVGQCLGAGQIERARKVVRSGLLLNLVVTAAVVVVVQLLAEPLICMFDGTSPEVIRCGVQYLRACCSINSLIYAAMYTLDSFAIGVGAAHVAMVNALLDAVVVRLPVGWLLAFPLSLGFSGIYLGQALSPILPALVGLAQVLGDNGGDTAGGDNFPIAVFPDILPVFQQTGHKVQVNLFTSYRCNALLPHFLHDFLHGGSLVIPGEYFQHHGGGARVKLVLHILVYNIAEGGRTAVILAFQSVFRMAPDNLLGQLSGVVFRHTFQHTFQNDTLRPLGNVFRSRKHLDAILPKLGLIMGAVVAVPGETV